MFPGQYSPAVSLQLLNLLRFRWLRRRHGIVLGAQMTVKFWLRNEI